MADWIVIARSLATHPLAAPQASPAMTLAPAGRRIGKKDISR
ncbi:MAG TPA: hypothetical protein VGH40_06475 [Roseiarcus sp.]